MMSFQIFRTCTKINKLRGSEKDPSTLLANDDKFNAKFPNNLGVPRPKLIG